ncbi:MAG: hypothetical protein AB8B64_22395 [Granulosicoccus sp.]
MGESIIFGSQSGTYVTVNRELETDLENDSAFVYETRALPDRAFPQTLTLAILDGAFRTTEAVSVPVASGPIAVIESGTVGDFESAGSGSQIFTNTVLRVNQAATNGSRTFISIEIFSGDVSDSSILCALPNEGDFTFPEQTLETLQTLHNITPGESVGFVSEVGAFESRVERNGESMIAIQHFHQGG